MTNANCQAACLQRGFKYCGTEYVLLFDFGVSMLMADGRKSVSEVIQLLVETSSPLKPIAATSVPAKQERNAVEVPD